MAHAAAWIETGSANISLTTFDAATLVKSGVHAPCELRDLRLINQADMSRLERRENAADML